MLSKAMASAQTSGKPEPSQSHAILVPVAEDHSHAVGSFTIGSFVGSYVGSAPRGPSPGFRGLGHLMQSPVLQQNTIHQSVPLTRPTSDWDADAAEPLLGASPESDISDRVTTRLQEHHRHTSPPALMPPLILDQLEAKDAPIEDGGNARAIVFGIINTLVGLPALVAFASIVFQANTYQPYVSKMAKFFFFSSAIHQLSFSVLSSLPFAVGQVQDVGLIFLSAMATSIATLCQEQGAGAEVALGTTLVTFVIATFTTGLCTVLVGRFKLARYVQYVPLPVVGGYLGYVGYFCLAGGMGLAAGVEINTLFSWSRLFDLLLLPKVLALALSTLSMILVMDHFTHPAALPLLLCFIPLLFHLLLWTSGTSLAQAQASGWCSSPQEGDDSPFWDIWRLFNLSFWDGSGILWSVIPRQIPSIIGLFLVVCFGSAMDVAAIQQDVPNPLDYDRELMTVGGANILTSLVGAGFTGSYIFSQTIFTLRAGVNNRLNGVVIVIAELFVFAIPFSLIQFIPNFYFGALLFWFGVDICGSWLVLSYRKLSRFEFVLLWLTFLAILQAGLEGGILIGIILSTIYFAAKYGQHSLLSIKKLALSSGMHSYERQAILDKLLARHCVGLAPRGFVFFGNAISICEEIEKNAVGLILEEKTTAPQPPSGLSAALPRPPSFASLNVDEQASDSALEALVLPFFCIVDLREVPSIDSTAARQLSTLANTLMSKNITLMLTGRVRTTHALLPHSTSSSKHLI